jgi:hypothetical protein
MLGQVMSSGSSSLASSRYFVYEVEGLRQNEETTNTGYPIRSSSTVLITVPYSRMNEEMQRISRLGGKIVKIHAQISPNGVTPTPHHDKKGEE